MKRTHIALTLALVAYLSGCGPKVEPKAPAPVVAAPAPVPPVAAVSFLQGTVSKHCGAGWTAAAINDSLRDGDSLDLAAKSAADLTVLGAVEDVRKIKGPAKATVRELLEKTTPAKQSALGGVAAAMKKMEKSKARMQTSTPTAVAGIRGTNTRVKVPPDTTKK